ncbi:MAG: single-stranded-DNA-specific exonuclease RecJ, partial [Lentisphaerae bacterium]|nr:single-stranded-DNA-specific exonuclease RecJ [Lentisphaerota bacterium]
MGACGGAASMWEEAAADAAAAAALARVLELPRPAARVLCARGHGEAAAARDFLNPRLSRLSDPFRIPG